MNWRAVLVVLGYLLVLLGLCQVPPLVVALLYDSASPYEGKEILAFSLTAGLAVGLGLAARFLVKGDPKAVGAREGFGIVTFSWIAAVLVGMLPFLFTGVTTSVTDAFFETMSGFTTTGATVFGTPAAPIESIPHGVQFWRCMTQWLGGMGIVVLSVALLSFLGVGGFRLIKAETPGGIVFERSRPRITDAAKEMWYLYLVISAMQVTALKIAGMSLFDAFCHTFTTMSTGGYSPHVESLAFFGPAAQWICIAFMFVAGANFALHAQLFRLRPAAYVRDPEFRVYLGVILAATAIGLAVVPYPGSVEEHVRTVAFQVVSIGTTTGYATTDFDTWPHLMRLVLVLLMFVGGSMGSTGGGMKAARLLIYAKVLGRELHKLIYPHAVQAVRAGDKVIEPKIVSNILAFGSVYSACFVVGTLVMAAYGYDLVSSATASAAALGNIGPGLAAVGPMANWAHLPAVAKWVMSLLMLLGRLELFSVIILFTPWVWKK